MNEPVALRELLSLLEDGTVAQRLVIQIVDCDRADWERMISAALDKLVEEGK